MYELEYTSASSEREVSSALQDFFQESERPRVLEIFTPSEVNDQILITYFKYVR